MMRLSLRPAVLLGVLVLAAVGCGSTGTADTYLRRDVENLALRLRHLEDRLAEMEESMGGLASRTFGAPADTVRSFPDVSLASIPLMSSITTSSWTAATRRSTSARARSSRKTFTHMVQDALRRAGYDPGAVDGVMGKKTAAALKKFQRDNKLKATGSTTPATWRLLNRYIAK